MAHVPLAMLETWLNPLLDQLKPAERRRLARDLAQGLRARQSQRISDQRNVDGSSYLPRAARRAAAGAQTSGSLRRQRARININAMFAQLRTAKHLKASASAAAATVEITGRSARIAAIHQHGLLDRPEPGGPVVRYPVRELLGASATDIEWLQVRLLAAIARG